MNAQGPPPPTFAHSYCGPSPLTFQRQIQQTGFQAPFSPLGDGRSAILAQPQHHPPQHHHAQQLIQNHRLRADDPCNFSSGGLPPPMISAEVAQGEDDDSL